MSASNKIIQAAAGNAAGEALYVEDVFSTYLYTGTDSSQTITNGIDLDGEGGFVWIKNRTNGANDHVVFSTETGVNQGLSTNTTGAMTSYSNSLTSFNSDGFTLGSTSAFGIGSNDFNNVTWTFRKAPKFFDVVTYTGNGVAGRTVAHNLGSVPGVMIVKSTDTSGEPWYVYHRSLGATKHLKLNTTDAENTSDEPWNNTAPTSSVFSLSQYNSSNGNGKNYVAYLFAHNDGDGEFGEDADQDIIKCGSYTGNGGVQHIDLGFEPQFLITKITSDGGDINDHAWRMFDNMRGIANGSDDANLRPNASDAEGNNNFVGLSATGFYLEAGHPEVNRNGEDYIYIAIRRGPMKTPEDATEVFDTHLDTSSSQTFYTTGFPVDAMLQSYTTFSTNKNHTFPTRLMGFNSVDKSLQTSSTSAETNLEVAEGWDSNTGFKIANEYVSSLETVHHAFRRAPGFFDVVAYEGTGANRTVNHNLGVAPEMMIVKKRNASDGWAVYHSGVDVNGDGAPETDFLLLNTTDQAFDNALYWNDTAPTESVFSLGFEGAVNRSGDTYIAYLFATLPGVSKVGSYTGNGTSQTIDCGFSTGARFVLIKNTTDGGDWYVWDATRGIISGNDPFLRLNTTQAEESNNDYVDPDASGFSVVNTFSRINDNNKNYIFLAIA